MNVINRSDLIVASFSLPNRNGGDTLLAIVKGTWEIKEAQGLSLSHEQEPVHLQPVYHAEIGQSTLLHDTDVVLEKPGTDCILLGRAWAPKGRVASVDVSFAVGSLRKTARVFGERIWMKWLWSVSVSRPVPFESIPLLWERAFGGVDRSFPDASAHEFCLENPVGRGLLARKTTVQLDGMRLPNIENPTCLIESPGDRPLPTGFAPIPPHWHPRGRYAGTYDEKWRNYRSPLPPEDLHPSFYSTAAPGLVTRRHLIGNEHLLIENASRNGRLNFPLPGVRPRVCVKTGHQEEELAMALDTLVAEPDQERLVLTWRGKLNVHGRIHRVDRIKVDLIKI
jgi:hypothetical protein